MNETDVRVNVVGNQLDMIANVLGSQLWIKRLQWPGRSGYAASDRQVITVNNLVEGYYKSHGHLTLYWVDRAGHGVFDDNKEAAGWIIRHITKYDQLP